MSKRALNRVEYDVTNEIIIATVSQPDGRVSGLAGSSWRSSRNDLKDYDTIVELINGIEFTVRRRPLTLG